MHQSWLKITFVSSGEFLGPMQEMRIKFKHLGIVARSRTLRNLVFKFLYIQNTSENHETWHGCHVMERYQHGVVKFLSHLGQVWVYASHKPELLTTSMMVSIGNVPPLGTGRYQLPLIAYKKNSCVNIEQQECCVNFCDFSGFVWTFLCIN